jgi:mRNA interferase RelE/StbE
MTLPSALVWQVDFTDEAERRFKKLSHPVQKRITRFIMERLQTGDDPRRLAKPLVGKRSGVWRWRVGDYRLVGRLEKTVHTILIVDIGHRKEIYD